MSAGAAYGISVSFGAFAISSSGAASAVRAKVFIALKCAKHSTFISQAQGDRPGLFLRSKECQSGAGGVVDLDELLFYSRVLAVHFELESGGLDGPDAALTPFGSRHLQDKIGFEFGSRLKLLNASLVELVESSLGLGSEDNGPGGKSVLESVHGRDPLTFGRLWAPGLRAVGAAG